MIVLIAPVQTPVQLSLLRRYVGDEHMVIAINAPASADLRAFYSTVHFRSCDLHSPAAVGELFRALSQLGLTPDLLLLDTAAAGSVVAHLNEKEPIAKQVVVLGESAQEWDSGPHSVQNFLCSADADPTGASAACQRFARTRQDVGRYPSRVRQELRRLLATLTPG